MWPLKHVASANLLSISLFQVMWLFREVSAPYLFFLAQLNPVIHWRSKFFKLRWGGLVEPLSEKV